MRNNDLLYCQCLYIWLLGIFSGESVHVPRSSLRASHRCVVGHCENWRLDKMGFWPDFCGLRFFLSSQLLSEVRGMSGSRSFHVCAGTRAQVLLIKFEHLSYWVSYLFWLVKATPLRKLLKVWFVSFHSNGKLSKRLLLSQHFLNSFSPCCPHISFFKPFV